ncbi:MAG TPA: hypothetical protein VNL91_03815 [Thermoanaerobaculia bacterium]|nr:hypothetical protein [Thermoanaerobaculia bacterium]
MRRYILPALTTFLLLLSLPLYAQDATQTSTTSDTCCSAKLIEIRFAALDGVPSAQIRVGWYRSSGALDHEDAFAVTDGDPSTATDNYLTGSGNTPQPIGLLRAIIEPLAGETGSIERRFRRRVVRWLVDSGRVSGVTVP